ncbi:PLP-dependent cysteine synthase family protein [Microbacterium sp. No. 7]|uniref:PLP-dependent cysteine synthase family protein n=1 Tax=Microbacterium sp. No. 7 TaxID=1714373 RepID=UPI000B20DF7B|nr:pyridoxal-phosphate dependent enzyme [Microbacterium sp. No. 7]
MTSYPDAALSRTYDSVLELIGNTPLVRLNVLTRGLPASVYVKLDHFNIGGSSKDRIAVNILREAVANGELQGGARIIETGQGNTSIALALAGVLTGHPSTVIAKPDLSPGKLNLLRLLGVDVIPGRFDVDKDDPEHAWSVAEREVAAHDDLWWSRQQSVRSNPAAHYASTGPELWHQTEGRITHFIAAIATGGTVSGTGRFLRERTPGIQVIGTTFDLPERPWADAALNKVFHRAPGHEELEQDWADNVDLEQLDALEARTKGEVIDFAFRLARTEGLLLGLSSVLSIKVALERAESANPGDVIVAFSADHARDYTAAEYDEQWLRTHDFGDIADRWFTN